MKTVIRQRGLSYLSSVSEDHDHMRRQPNIAWENLEICILEGAYTKLGICQSWCLSDNIWSANLFDEGVYSNTKVLIFARYLIEFPVQMHY